MMETTTRTDEPTRAGPRFALDLAPSDIAATIARSALRRVLSFVDDDAESSFLVALTEIVVNAIDEHHRNAPEANITVEVVFEPSLRVVVVDHGHGLDAALAGGSDAAPTAQSGRGLALARAFVPGIEFVATDTGTTAILPLEGFAVRR